jgi:hypothetical protein
MMRCEFGAGSKYVLRHAVILAVIPAIAEWDDQITSNSGVGD